MTTPPAALTALLDQQFEAGAHIGIQLACYYHGEPAFDIARGQIGPDDSRPVTAATLFPTFSAMKGPAALVVHLLIARGLLDLESPVARYWPAFDRPTKRTITVTHVLAHQAGLHAFPAPFSIENLTDWDGGIRWVESLEPAWEPGTATGYHAVTWGWLVGGLVQQVTGRHIADVIADEVAEPLGVAAELFTGLPPAIPLEAAATLRIHVAGEGQPVPADSDFYRALPRDLWQHSNDEAFRRNPLPSISGHATARALVRMYALLADDGELDGVRLCGSSDIARMSALVTKERDRVLGGRIAKAAGFMLGGPGAYGAMPPRATAFGHAGAGGSIAFADPERHVAVAILVNNMGYWPSGKGPIQALVDTTLAAFE